MSKQSSIEQLSRNDNNSIEFQLNLAGATYNIKKLN